MEKGADGGGISPYAEAEPIVSVRWGIAMGRLDDARLLLEVVLYVRVLDLRYRSLDADELGINPSPSAEPSYSADATDAASQSSTRPRCFGDGCDMWNDRDDSADNISSTLIVRVRSSPTESRMSESRKDSS